DSLYFSVAHLEPAFGALDDEVVLRGEREQEEPFRSDAALAQQPAGQYFALPGDVEEELRRQAREELPFFAGLGVGHARFGLHLAHRGDLSREALMGHEI